MPVWDDVISERDRKVFESAGWGKEAGFGARPAVIVIDVNYNFCGDKPEPILESIKRWRYSCGEVAWKGVEAIKRLLTKAREKRIPIFYTTTERRPDGFDMGAWNRKSYRSADPVDVEGGKGVQIVAEVAPEPRDIVISKKKPSAFFGTPLLSYLIDLKVDTLIVTGTTTSGCVRATCVDAFSYNYYTVVPEECVWDRGELSHKVNLFDLDQKYVDVVPLEKVLAYLDTLPSDLYAGLLPAGD
jgi:nicotinamidase-related amidase